MVVKTDELLQDLGLGVYEARAYHTLLSLQAATPYQVAQQAGIPSSKIYETIRKLEERQIIFSMQEGSKQKYAAVPLEEFITLYRNSFSIKLHNLELQIPLLKQENAYSCIRNFNDYATLTEKSQEFILGAKESIMLSCWPNELNALQPVLESRANISIAIVHFGELETEHVYAMCFQHPIRDTIYAEKKGRGFSMVTDSNFALTACIADDGSVQGAWSLNSGFVTVTEDYIKHDIYIMKIVERFDRQLTETYGENYELLRRIYSNEVVK